MFTTGSTGQLSSALNVEPLQCYVLLMSVNATSLRQSSGKLRKDEASQWVRLVRVPFSILTLLVE